jgi:hypothetical protein
MQKCSDGDEYFSEYFFQSWNEVANIQKIAGWYKVCIQGISKPNKKTKKKAVRIGLREFLATTAGQKNEISHKKNARYKFNPFCDALDLLFSILY